MGAGKNQLRFPLMAVNGIVTETLDMPQNCRNTEDFCASVASMCFKIKSLRQQYDG